MSCSPNCVELVKRVIDVTKQNGNNRFYRVELWTDEIRLLDRIQGVFPQFRTLDPYVSRLVQEGVEGEAVLVDDETGEIVGRQKVTRLTSRR
jgi:hypothetical protein